MLFSTALQTVFCLGALSTSPPGSGGRCKPLPSDDRGWPSRSEWNALNTTVSGRLTVPEPLGAVCHTDFPVYNNASCVELQRSWTNSSWHASNPWTSDWNDVTCLPDPSQPCSDRGYPEYVVEAETVADVQAAVKFAARTGVRIIVKGTGHDFLGRSAGPGTLSIWTHLFRGIEVTRDDSRALKYGGAAAVRLAAGMRWGEVYTEMARQHLTVVGGADNNVGVGGLLLGGGHSPISAYYGFPADHILEMEIVTADGEHRTINEKTNADLFWAMRGGGGSTFAVLISVTVKAFPPLPGVTYAGQLLTTTNSRTFWNMTAYFHTQLPRISKAGGMGYYFILPDATSLPNSAFPIPPGLDPEHAGVIFEFFHFPNRTLDEVDSTMRSLASDANSSSWAEDEITGGGGGQPFEDFMATRVDEVPQSVGSVVRVGSWLLDETGLTEPIENSADILRAASSPPTPILGHLVSGRKVRDVKIPGGGNAILPAWRKAYSHIIVLGGWPPNDVATKSAVTRQIREQGVPTLRQLSPNSGAYMNEADPTNPDWQRDYFGDNYSRLLSVKRKWDPKGVFWCKPCVGHELWEVVDGPPEEDPTEWGVGQVGGRICRRR